MVVIFEDYFVADWTQDGTPDLIVRTYTGDMLLYPFKNGSFYNAGGPVKVGNGWNFMHYLIANRKKDGTPDLIVKSSTGESLLYLAK